MFGKFRLLDNYLMVGRYVLSTIIYFLHLFLKIKNQNFTPITLYNSKHNLVTSLTKFQIWSHFRFSHLFLSCPYGFTKKWVGKYGGKQSNLWSSQSSSWKPQNSQKRTKKRHWLISITVQEKVKRNSYTMSYWYARKLWHLSFENEVGWLV